MSRSVLGIFALAALASIAASAVSPSTKLTIVADFQGPHSKPAMTQMQRELDRILLGTGLSVDWKAKPQAASSTYENLVVVRFKGKCILEPVGLLYDERGPLAFTHTSDGEVLPFSNERRRLRPCRQTLRPRSRTRSGSRTDPHPHPLQRTLEGGHRQDFALR